MMRTYCQKGLTWKRCPASIKIYAGFFRELSQERRDRTLHGCVQDSTQRQHMVRIYTLNIKQSISIQSSLSLFRRHTTCQAPLSRATIHNLSTTRSSEKTSAY